MSGILSNTLASTRFLKSCLFSFSESTPRNKGFQLKSGESNKAGDAQASWMPLQFARRSNQIIENPRKIIANTGPFYGATVNLDLSSAAHWSKHSLCFIRASAQQIRVEQDQMKQSFYRYEPKLKPDQCSEWRMQLSTFYVKSFVVKERLRNFCVYQVPGQRWKSGIWRI